MSTKQTDPQYSQAVLDISLFNPLIYSKKFLKLPLSSHCAASPSLSEDSTSFLLNWSPQMEISSCLKIAKFTYTQLILPSTSSTVYWEPTGAGNTSWTIRTKISTLLGLTFEWEKTNINKWYGNLENSKCYGEEWKMIGTTRLGIIF